MQKQKKRIGSKITPVKITVLAAIASLIMVAIALSSSTYYSLLHKGPMTPGHEQLVCTSCHERAPGSTRQQMQAIVAGWMGWRNDVVHFFFRPAQDSDCADCHDRRNDRHPTYRFKEPRFLEAIKVVDARSCMSCHKEHRGARVATEVGFCVACHKDISVANDPITPSHKVIAVQDNWHTCLQCHDFHNGHKFKAPKNFDERIDLARINDYLRNVDSPYGVEKTNKAKSQR